MKESSVKSVVWSVLPASLLIVIRSCRIALARVRRSLFPGFLVREKWKKDQLHCRDLHDSHKELYYRIQLSHYQRFDSFINIINPCSYNEKVQWLKLFGQQTEMINLCDKIKVRDYVASVVGERYLSQLYAVCNSVDKLPLDELPGCFVVKCNHDSGSVFLINDKDEADWGRIKKRLKVALSFRHAVDSGEWPYQYITPRILIEEHLCPKDERPPADYKFHCVDGQVKWLQYIFDRGFDTKEMHLTRSLERLPYQMGEAFLLSQEAFDRPSNWEEMLMVAEKLSSPFKYVRIDLYNCNGRIVFGEMTFFPRGGFYLGGDNLEFGKMMTFDLNMKNECLH